MVEGHTRGGCRLCYVAQCRPKAGRRMFAVPGRGLGAAGGMLGGLGGGFFQGDLRWEGCGRWAWKGGGGEVRGG